MWKYSLNKWATISVDTKPEPTISAPNKLVYLFVFIICWPCEFAVWNEWMSGTSVVRIKKFKVQSSLHLQKQNEDHLSITIFIEYFIRINRWTMANICNSRWGNPFAKTLTLTNIFFFLFCDINRLPSITESG